VRYEVDYTWADNDIEPVEMSEEIQAHYQDAALRGGRIIASHTLVFDGQEHIFFVGEFPDEPNGTESANEGTSTF
jgi:hypothetical protein